MTQRTRIPVPKGSNFYDYLWDIHVAFSAFYAAMERYNTNPEVKSDNEKLNMQGIFSKQTECLIAFPLNNVFLLALRKSPPDIIWFEIRQGFPHPGDVDLPGAVDTGVGGPIWAVMDATFALFSERCIDWVRRNRSNELQSSTSVANFCRVVRNAVVHGGKININSPNSPTVSWRGIEYNYNHHGRRIFSDLAHGDFILLSYDLYMEMKTLGAPDILE